VRRIKLSEALRMAIEKDVSEIDKEARKPTIEPEPTNEAEHFDKCPACGGTGLDGDLLCPKCAGSGQAQPSS